MSVRKVKTKSGEIKWEVRVHEDGRGSKRITRRFDRKIDAEDFVDDHKKGKKEAVDNPFANVSFKGKTYGGEAAYWLSVKRNIFSASHLKRVEGVLNEQLKAWKDEPVKNFTADFIADYQRSEKEKGLSNNGVNRKTEVVCAILVNSVKSLRIPVNPSLGFAKFPNDADEMSFWSLHEAKSFLKVMDQTYPRGSSKRWVYVVYLLAINTGLRAGEIWGLMPKDIFPEHGALRIVRQFNRVTQGFTNTKGKASRDVPCSSELLNELRMWIQGRRIKLDETIFQNEMGKPVCHDHFADRQYQKDLALWGGRVIRFHDLRHTSSTLMVASNVNLKVVKEICGHQQIETTMRYAHMVAGSVKEVSRNFSVVPDDRETDAGKVG